jgi:hypothetical protein
MGSLSASRLKPWVLQLAISISVVFLVALGGCGDTTKPVVGQIAFTNASGVTQPPVAIVQHGTSIYLYAVVTNDPESLGIDWTVTCSSSVTEANLPAGTVDTSCGSFAPYHTLSGPIPPSYDPTGTGIVTQYTAPQSVPSAGTVTIVAHATTLPASTSSITLTIM